jgi:hypothetical protein
MNIKKAKQIDLVEFLACLGYTPVKRQIGKNWYCSPFRNEKTPSFKVNTDFNLWYDFGLAEGGDIIALGTHLYNTNDVSIILKKIAKIAYPNEQSNVSMHESPRRKLEFTQKKADVINLTNHSLLSYLDSRKININIAIRYCREIHYSYSHNNYYGIAFENLSGGYEIRNRYFKGCRGQKDISVIRGSESAPKNKCCVFEGFMDFLSYMTIAEFKENCCDRTSHSDYLILNSVSNLKKAVNILSEYQQVHCYLDNDEAGHLATKYLMDTLLTDVRDESFRYKGFKDVNDFLINSGMSKNR